MSMQSTPREDGRPKFAPYSAPLKLKVMEMIADGISSNAIARQTGVSKGVVSKVRRGLIWTVRDDPIEEVLSSGETGRCPGCGHMVWLPCVACNMK